MKKIMIAACAIALAGLTQAASVGWGYGGAISNAEAKGSAYSFFVIGQNGVTSEAQISAMIAAGTDVSAYAFGSGTTTANGIVNQPAASSGKTITVTETTTLEGFMVIFNDDKVADATKFLVIGNDDCGTVNGFSKTAGSTTASVNFAAGNVANYVNNASNWQDIPEPTSGLLLLLGVAGLALKRKRA